MSRRQFKHVNQPRPLGSTPRAQWFVNQKRRVRRSMAIAQRWRITQDPNGAGVFTSDQFIPGSPSWEKAFGPLTANNRPSTHWADIYFMSARPIRDGVFYNATIVTAADDLAERMEEESHNFVEQLLPPNLRAKMFGRSIGAAPVFEQFNNRTHYGAQAEYLKTVLATLPTRSAHISCRVQPDYVYGVGLEMVTDTECLTMHSIANDIARFQQLGEKDFTIETDIAPHLPALRAHLRSTIDAFEALDAQARGVPTPPQALSEEGRLHLFALGVPLRV